MAAFFSLASGRSSDNNQDTSPQPNNPTPPQISQETWFLYNRNNNQQQDDDQTNIPTPYHSLELWHQQQQQQHQQNPNHLQHQRLLQDFYPTAAGSPTEIGGTSRNSGLNIVPDNRSAAFLMMRSVGSGGGGGEGSTTSGGGSISCQDCGNKAKKDCRHMRCRTCCKSRGFQCQTHVKSTWVPAAKRRERQNQLAAIQNHDPEQQKDHDDDEEDNHLRLRDNSLPKRLRDNHANTSASLFCSRLPASNTLTSGGLGLANLPAEVSSSAVFRCVRVSSIDSADDEFAYQTAVSIGGHVFKGILYDQGVEASHHLPGESSSGGSGGGIQQFNLITNNTSTSNDSRGNASVSIQFLDPSLYPAQLSSFMAGTQFFPPPR